MKNNIFGYVFFIFIVIIMGFAIYRVNSGEKKEENANTDILAGVATSEKGTDLTLAISGFDTINPIITKNKNVQDATKLIYESLVDITADGKAVPCLAKEWETADGITYIIKLRTGVKWSDGSYFSSNDVKYTIDKLKSRDAKNAVYAENVKYLKEVDIIDNTTLKIILSEKIQLYQYYLTFPILSSNYYTDADFWNTDKNDAPISTGRFQISQTHGNSIILTKNPYWWNKENDNSVIEKVTINFYSTVAELYNAFKLGGIDLISTTNKDYKNYIGKIGYNITEAEGRNFAFLALNTQSNLLSDVNIRKALRYAINRDEIVANIYKKSYSKANFPLPLSNYLVNDPNESYFNIGEMEKCLKDSGWNLRKKIWQKVINHKIKRLEFNLIVRKNSNREEVADYIGKSLLEQGIIINVIKASDADYEKYINNKNYDIILAEMTNPIAPDLTTYFARGNIANFDNKDAKEIIEVINNITNEEELKVKYQKLFEIYTNEVPYIGIARNKLYVTTNTYLNGKIEPRWYNLFFGFKDWYKN